MNKFIVIALVLLAGCADDDGVTSDVLPFISYNGISESAAVIKCDSFGYAAHPEHHAACVRMVRADYCGDGTSWTRDGVPINLYDNLGINTDDALWTVDAAWSPAGALCIGETHRDYQPGEPECLEELLDSGCGLGFAPDALIINEVE